jgi:hypothetical protein
METTTTIRRKTLETSSAEVATKTMLAINQLKKNKLGHTRPDRRSVHNAIHDRVGLKNATLSPFSSNEGKSSGRMQHKRVRCLQHAQAQPAAEGDTRAGE